MGGLRFTVGAVQQIMKGETHSANIAVLPHEQAGFVAPDTEPDNQPGRLSTPAWLWWQLLQGSSAPPGPLKDLAVHGLSYADQPCCTCEECMLPGQYNVHAHGGSSI